MPMAEPVYPNNETRFPAYPEPRGAPAADEPRYHPNLAPVERAGNRSSLALNSAAENIGSAVGNAVENARTRLQEMKQRFTVIRGRAKEDISTKATEVAEDLKDQAQRTAVEARTRAERLARQDPFRFIMMAAAVGVVLGIMLRIWRDHAD
jgi:ElaB/YqjD/DUF883 family membrane-anchored ribosome-binding protein